MKNHPNTNTNITIRSQLFEYYSNTELFAHLWTSGVCLQGLIRVHNACSSSVSSIVLHCNGRQTFNLECCMLVYAGRLGLIPGPHATICLKLFSSMSDPHTVCTMCALFVSSFNCLSHIAMLFSTLKSTFLQPNDTWQVSEMYLMRRTLHC